MSGIVLAVGALMLVAGVYEMFVGNSDILSERGWSAFIAGAVLLSGGVVTMALGVSVRALERLRVAILRDGPAVGQLAPSSEPTVPVSAAVPQPDLFDEPALEQAPTAPVKASAPIHLAPAHEAHSTIADQPLTHSEPSEPAEAEPRHDWLDHSFADLEREMADRHKLADESAPVHRESPALAAELVPVASLEPLPEPDHKPRPASNVTEEPSAGDTAHDASAPLAGELEPTPSTATGEQATVSAREAPAASAVIGRYESEGTSYVMYADGSIDAQSEAGVYRFASMAELKTFIES